MENGSEAARALKAGDTVIVNAGTYNERVQVTGASITLRARGTVVIQGFIEGASAYELRWAPTVNGTTGTWTTQFITRTRPATSITGLTPGTTYTVLVRSFNDNSGFSDWSDPITRVCT